MWGDLERHVMVKSVNVLLMWMPTVLVSIQEMEKDILCSSSWHRVFFGRVVCQWK